MTQADLEREVAVLTGESRETIRARGFMLVEPLGVKPLTIDWDQIYPSDLPRRVHRPERRAKVAS